jgi:hypothetical protein
VSATTKAAVDGPDLHAESAVTLQSNRPTSLLAEIFQISTRPSSPAVAARLLVSTVTATTALL